MKSMWPVDPRFKKLPRGISITTSTSGGSGNVECSHSALATSNTFRDELFDLGIDVLPHVHRCPKLSVFFRQRSVVGSPCSDGGELLQNRRQRLIENLARGVRFRGKLAPLFVRFHGWGRCLVSIQPPCCQPTESGASLQ